MNYALTIYPLSAAFRRGLEETLNGPLTYLSVQDLRRMSPFEAALRLRRLEATRLVLPLEDESSRATLGLLVAVAAVAKADRVDVVGPDLAFSTVRRWEILPALVKTASASLRSVTSAVWALHRLGQLRTAARTPAAFRFNGGALYLNANLWFGVKAGGSVGHIAGVANELQRQGHNVTYASVGGRGMVQEKIPLLALTPPAVFGLPYELNYYRFAATVERQLKSIDPRTLNFIYQRMSVGNYAGVRLSRRWGIPLVIEYNGSEVWIARNWGHPMRYERLALGAEEVCLRHAHLVVTISDVLRAELMERGVEPERIVAYPNCIDPGVFDPAQLCEAGLFVRRRLEIAEEDLTVMFLGTFGQWHGAEVLARAIRKLVDESAEFLTRYRVRFVLVGDGLKMGEVRGILGADAVNRFVVYTGLVPQREAPSYLAMADAVVSPHVANADGSPFFGSPTKLFEYMAMGKPIIASDLDQIGEVLRNSLRVGNLPDHDSAGHETDLAILTPPGDVASLAKALRFLVTHPRWRTTLGANARREALERYTWKHHVETVLAGLGSVSK